MEILPGIFSIYVFDPNDIRLEFSCQPSNGEGEPLIVPQVTQTKDEALAELKTLTGDKGWLDRVTTGLAELTEWRLLLAMCGRSPSLAAASAGLPVRWRWRARASSRLCSNKRREFGEAGVGLQMAPNALSVLDALGVGEPAKRHALLIERLLMMDAVTGAEVANVPLDERFRERFGNPYAVAHRADIHGALLEGCRAHAAGRVAQRQPGGGFPGVRQGRRGVPGKRRADRDRGARWRRRRALGGAQEDRR